MASNVWFSQGMLVWYGNIREEVGNDSIRAYGNWGVLMLIGHWLDLYASIVPAHGPSRSSTAGSAGSGNVRSGGLGSDRRERVLAPAPVPAVAAQ